MGGALKGSSGSVRSLALHAGQPLIASAGLDRCLRVHSTATRKLLGKLYLKQQLTSVSFLPVAPQPAPAGMPLRTQRMGLPWPPAPWLAHRSPGTVFGWLTFAKCHTLSMAAKYRLGVTCSKYAA